MIVEWLAGWLALALWTLTLVDPVGPVDPGFVDPGPLGPYGPCGPWLCGPWPLWVIVE